LNRAYGFSSVLAATEDFEGLNYRPRTKETRAVYELILAFVHEFLGDVPQDAIRSAGDVVLDTLKNDSLKDFDKKREIESIIGNMPSERFAQLVNLGKKIIDYNSGDTEAMNVDENGDKVGEIDDELGVAVVFDEDEDEDEDEDQFEIRDEDDEEEGVDEATASKFATEDMDEDEEVSDEDMESFESVQAGGLQTSRRGVPKDAEKLSPHQVDAFWLQRTVATHYPDPHTAQEKSSRAFNILSSESINTRDCENELMALFEFDKYELVKILTRNRDVISWCTKLARACHYLTTDQR
jgi:pre-mRNA-splicing helicase BRR2